MATQPDELIFLNGSVTIFANRAATLKVSATVSTDQRAMIEFKGNHFDAMRSPPATGRFSESGIDRFWQATRHMINCGPRFAWGWQPNRQKDAG
jgi:hypothetical protein